MQCIRHGLVLCGDCHDPFLCLLCRDLFLLSSRNHVWEGSWNLSSKEYARKCELAGGKVLGLVLD